jgi:hypothetical protein
MTNTTSASSIQTKSDLFLASFLFLFLELAFIRWLPAQVLYLTFFTNTVLLASFLGLALGCLAARSQRDWLRWTPLALTVLILSAVGMESVRLALQDIVNVGNNASGSSPQVVFFGSEVRVGDVSRFVVPIELVAGAFFVLVAVTMTGVGQLIGRRFVELPRAVSAYIVNITGSLVGIVAFTVISSWLSPVWWFLLASVGLVFFLAKERRRNWAAIALAAIAPLLLLPPQWFGLGVIRKMFPEEFWSPYYRINYQATTRTIVTNLIGQQSMVSRNTAYPAYAIPFLLNRDSGQESFEDILIIGAGSGNDVSRALQWAAPDAHIDAVEIDPVIQRLGERDNPDHPYQDPRVNVHIGDGRNFLRSTKRKYDLIVFALVDSLVLHSSVSNLRLESYLFTRESLEDVRGRLKPNGLFVMYNYFRQGWIVSRLAGTAGSVFGREPLTLTWPARDRIAAGARADAFTIFFVGPRAAAIQNAFGARGAYHVSRTVPQSPVSPDGFAQTDGADQFTFRPVPVEIPANLREAEDTWPFLYLRNPMIPELSWHGIAVTGVVSVLLLTLFAGRGTFAEMSALDGRAFFLGAGFMLLETKTVVQMALIFGGTWMVNTMVFSTVLVMVLAANLWVERSRGTTTGAFYVALLVALGVNIVVPLNALLGRPVVIQGMAAGALSLSPIFCAGVIFARLFARSSAPDRTLAWNIAGSILGGLAETMSLLVGFRWLLAVAGGIYVASWALGNRKASLAPEKAIPAIQS